MKKCILLVVIIQCLCISHLRGQETMIILGKVIDETGEPIIGANISVPHTLLGTTTNLEGNFQLKIPGNTQSLKISFIGYKTIDVTPEENMKITLQPNVEQINEVVVTAQKPAVQVTAEKTTVFPALSPITSSGNAYSVLKNLPGVIINSNGSIYLYGKSGVKLLVDGKNSYLSGTDLVNYLMSLPAGSISKIDLINHPSAKYEAAGNAGIIDICTQKTNSIGHNFNVNTNYEQGKYGRTNNNLSLGYHKNKLNLNGMYGYYFGSDYVDLTITRDFQGTTKDPVIFFDGDSYRRRKDKKHYFNFGLDYYADPKTTLGVAVKGNLPDRIENGTLNSLFYTSTSPNDSTVYSITDNEENKKNITSTVYFHHKIDSLGKEISASADGLYYSINETQFHNDVLTRLLGSSSESISHALKDGSIKMYSGRVDLAYPISDKLRFDAGAKSDFVNINNASDYENKVDELWTIDPDLSTTFFYRENINALYVSGKVQKNALTAEAGLRVENTNIKTDSVNQNYTDFFPNLTLSWQLPNSNALNLTYDRRTDRPNYRDLNPFVYVFDSYTYEQGNTELKPQFTNRVNLSYTIRKAYKFGLFYTNTHQAIIKTYSVKPGIQRVFVMPTNMSTFQSYGIQADAGQISFTRWLHTGVHAELVQNKYEWTENSSPMKNKNLTFQIGLQNQIKLPWGWSGEVSGFYNSKMAYGQIDVLPIWQISSGIQHSLFDGNATLNIFSNDWFHSNLTRIKGVIGGSNVTTKEFDDHAIIGMSFTYRFKKGIDPQKTNRKENIDSKRITL